MVNNRENVKSYRRCKKKISYPTPPLRTRTRKKSSHEHVHVKSFDLGLDFGRNKGLFSVFMDAVETVETVFLVYLITRFKRCFYLP
jgi:hypothetical protein